MCGNVYKDHEQGGVCGQRITLYDFSGAPIASPVVNCKKRSELWVTMALCASPCMLDKASLCCFVPAEVAYMFPCCRSMGCCPDQQGSRRALGTRGAPRFAPRSTPAVAATVSVEEGSAGKTQYERVMHCLSSGANPTAAKCTKRGAQALSRRRRRAQQSKTMQCEHGGRPTASTGCVIVVAGLPTVFHFHANTCADAVTQRWGKYAATKPKVATFASAFAGGFAGIPTAALATVGAGQSFVASCPRCTWPTAFDVVAGVLALNGTTLSGHMRVQGGAIMMKTGGRATVSDAIFRNNKATVGSATNL